MPNIAILPTAAHAAMHKLFIALRKFYSGIRPGRRDSHHTKAAARASKSGSHCPRRDHCLPEVECLMMVLGINFAATLLRKPPLKWAWSTAPMAGMRCVKASSRFWRRETTDAA